MNNTLYFHEAAHAVCGWYLGLGIVEVQVATHIGQRLFFKGGRYSTTNPGLTLYKRPVRMKNRISRKNASNRILVAAAGPLMNRIMKHQPWTANAFSFHGQSDEVVINKTISRSNISHKEADRLIAACDQFLQTPEALNAVEGVAFLLHQKQKISGKDVSRICRKSFPVVRRKRW